MIKNLHEYFLPEQEYYLNEILYKRIECNNVLENGTAICEDSISTNINESHELNILVTRKFYFEPEQIFKIEISFGADLKFNPEKENEYDWKTIDLSQEVREHGEFVLSNLMSRISLLYAQITSSYGQQPLILPPNVIKSNE